MRGFLTCCACKTTSGIHLPSEREHSVDEDLPTEQVKDNKGHGHPALHQHAASPQFLFVRTYDQQPEEVQLSALNVDS